MTIEIRDHLAAVAHPWDRLPNESAESYLYFLAYLHHPTAPPHGRRFLSAIADDLGVPKQTFYRTSSRLHWLKRAAAWDAHVAATHAAKKLEALATSARQEAEAYAETWRRAHRIADTVLRDVLDRLQREEGATIAVRDALALLDRATYWQRLADGQPTEKTEVENKAPIDYGRLTDAEFATLSELTRKAAGEK